MQTRKRLPAWLRWLLGLLAGTVMLFALLVGGLVWQQDAVVQQLLHEANATLPGQVTLAGSRISPFANFPYVSIDLEEVRLYETKDLTQPPLLAVQDLYLGFDLWAVLQGQYQIKALTLKEGYLKVVQYPDGRYNLLQALQGPDTGTEPAAAALDLNVQRIKLRDIDLHHISQATGTDVDAFIKRAQARLSLRDVHTFVGLDAQMEMNLIVDGDTSYLKRKPVALEMELDYDSEQTELRIFPSEVLLAGAAFRLEGLVALGQPPYLDLKVEGAKPNFDLLIALAPDDLVPTLRSYDNRGEVFFEATVKGRLTPGRLPRLEARFGCAEGMIRHRQSRRTVEAMAFQGYLRTVADTGGLAALEFGLEDFQAQPETGIFSGKLRVQNFLSPEIDLQLRSEFDLNFLVDFFNLEGLSALSGSVKLTMNFHDIIDLQQPEKSIERLNESYFTELEIRDLGFTSEAYPLPVERLTIIGHIEGHEAIIDTLSGQVGRSDVFATARISDLPALIHHTRDSVWVDLYLRAGLIDLAELTYNDSTQKPAVDEQIRDLRLDLGFASSAFAFTESPHLPVGEFFIRELHADLQHYPHRLHNFRADVLIEEEDLRLIDFSGKLDSSDFHFTGRLRQYHRWMQPSLEGDTELEFDLTSRRLRLEDLLVYRGENYLPADYRHEDFRDLALKGRTELHFRANALQSIDLYLDALSGKMQLHDARFEDFRGRLHLEDEHLTAENFRGRLGNSDFALDLNWYLGPDPQLRLAQHRVALRSQRLDLNQLLAWNPPPAGAVPTGPVDHDTTFSLFDLPFWNMDVRADIGWLRYHAYELYDLHAALRMRADRYLHLDTCHLRAAGGTFDIQGSFDATDSTQLYLLPKVKARNVDLDRFMVKFDNFGQDYLVSENLHGYADCDLSGRLRIHEDLTPMLEASELDIALEVRQGRLDNYEPMTYLAEYFADKNLNRIRFDTLRNTFRLRNNVLAIPRMTINSSLGYLELWGTQDLGDKMEMDLSLKIPLSLVSQAAFSKLFKRAREEVDPDQEDAIIYQDKGKRQPYTFVKLRVDADDYEVRLLKKGEYPATE